MEELILGEAKLVDIIEVFRLLWTFLPFRAFCVEGPQNLMFVRPCVRPSVCRPHSKATFMHARNAA